MRHYSKTDELCFSIDQLLRTLAGNPVITGRQYPAHNINESNLTTAQRKHSAALMRINHAGEVCAQALYHGQGVVSRSDELQKKMRHAAIEEGDHLAWCKTRLMELGSHTSYLNPFWYAGSFAIGLAAGLVGDKWSLGFVAETEQQVLKHLENHLQQLPEQDRRSHHILQQMHTDEAEHRDAALNAGAAILPPVIKKLMSFISKVMVKTTYWI